MTGNRRYKTGQENENDEHGVEGVKRPRRFSVRNLKECVDAAKELNKGCIPGKADAEGFVVVDSDYHRIKVKSPAYLIAHRMAINGDTSKKKLLPLASHIDDDGETNTRENVRALITVSPEAFLPLKYYEFRIAEERQKLILTINYARTLYEEYDHDKKAVYEKLAKASYCKQVMRSIKMDGSVEDIAKSFEEEYENNKKKSMLSDYISDYEKPGIY